jgi:hypothetical protein
VIARCACHPDILVLSGTFPTFQLIGVTLPKPQLEILSGPWHIRIQGPHMLLSIAHSVSHLLGDVCRILQ